MRISFRQQTAWRMVEFEIEIVLDEKPATNAFRIEGAEDLDFFYQPELTPEENAEGAFRPENVVGSYAVYHKTKANHRVGDINYATEKAYRNSGNGAIVRTSGFRRVGRPLRRLVFARDFTGCWSLSVP
jgi:hypothetical protein